MLLIVIGIGLYYNVIIAWIIYYLIEVFISLPTGTLPWTTCGNRWDQTFAKLWTNLLFPAGTRRIAWTSTLTRGMTQSRPTVALALLHKSSFQERCWSSPLALIR